MIYALGLFGNEDPVIPDLTSIVISTEQLLLSQHFRVMHDFTQAAQNWAHYLLSSILLPSYMIHVLRNAHATAPATGPPYLQSLL
jgi:hypothetical protein